MQNNVSLGIAAEQRLHIRYSDLRAAKVGHGLGLEEVATPVPSQVRS